MVYFVYVDHSSDEASPRERTIVEAESASEAGKKFYADGDMAGCYVEEIVQIT